MISEFIRRCHYRESVSVLVEVDGELEPRELNHNQVRVIFFSGADPDPGLKIL
jgi:hypothetical protein